MSVEHKDKDYGVSITGASQLIIIDTHETGSYNSDVFSKKIFQ